MMESVELWDFLVDVLRPSHVVLSTHEGDAPPHGYHAPFHITSKKEKRKKFEMFTKIVDDVQCPLPFPHQ